MRNQFISKVARVQKLCESRDQLRFVLYHFGFVSLIQAGRPGCFGI